jgi:hypothetical protein
MNRIAWFLLSVLMLTAGGFILAYHGFMDLLGRTSPYDLSRLLEAVDVAEGFCKIHKAIARQTRDPQPASFGIPQDIQHEGNRLRQQHVKP